MNPTEVHMDSYLAFQEDVNEGYKGMDASLSAVVLEEKGWDVPALFSYTDPDTGDRYAINVTARANLIERGRPKEA